MLKVGLTGNIGSGKSVVASVFSVLGIPVFHADLAGREVLETPRVVEELARLFGKDVITADGKPIRSRLAGIVFNDTQALDQLNSLVHPGVEKRWLEWYSLQSGSPYVIHEAAILFESGFHELLDKVIVVKAPYSVRKERVMQRDGISGEEFDARAARQYPETRLLRLADHIVDNCGEEALIPQVLRIDRELRVP